MRTDLTERPFPYTCHAVKKPAQPFFAFLAIVAFIVFYWSMVVDTPLADGRTRLYFSLFVVFWLFCLASLPFSAGIREVLPNRVVVFGGATWITPKLFPIELLLLAGSGAVTLSSGVILTHQFGGFAVFEAGLEWIILGPGFVVLGALMIIDFVWQQLRGIRMTPESITYWRGIGKITLRWDELGDSISTNDVRDHEERRFVPSFMKKYQRFVPGAKIVVPVERVMDAKLRVHWEDADTPRLLLETDHLTVEPSSLLTAILALRDNPELRPLLGTRESKDLFNGPPWRVRRHMYRTQQWWPKGAAPDGIAVDRDGVVKEFQ